MSNLSCVVDVFLSISINNFDYVQKFRWKSRRIYFVLEGIALMRLSLKSLFSNPAFLTLSTILFVCHALFAGIPILGLIELKTYDLRFFSRGQVQPSPAVVMALIDEKKPEYRRALALAQVQARGSGERSVAGWGQSDRF